MSTFFSPRYVVGRWVECDGAGTVHRPRVAEHEPGPPDEDLVGVSEATLVRQSWTVQSGAVPGAEVADEPGRPDPLENQMYL